MPTFTKCCVVGCKTHLKPEKEYKHYHRFPVDSEYRNVWIKFTRRGSDFVPKRFSKICEDHFHPSCFKFTLRTLKLQPQSVPTIFTSTTGESIVLTFDPYIFTYLESDKYLIPAYDRDDREQELLEQRERRLKEIKELCRFCSEELSVVKRVSIEKLKEYSIDPPKIMNALGITTTNRKIFSEVLCEECFQEIVSFDGFRKRCIKAQNEIVEELRELDEKLQEIRGHNADTIDWDTKPADSLNDDDETDDENGSFTFPILNPVKKETVNNYQPINFHSVLVKTETKEEPLSDVEDNFEMNVVDLNHPYDSDFDMISEAVSQEVSSPIMPNDVNEINDNDGDFSTAVFQDDSVDDVKFEINDSEISAAVDEAAMDTAECSKKMGPRAMFENIYYKPSKTGDDEKFMNISTQYIYECFYCRLKYAGRDMFTRHDCQITEVKCTAKDCEQKFKSMSGFNSHMTRIHKLPKLTRFVCKLCKMSLILTEDDFKNHGRKCDKNIANKVNKTAVECIVCKKLYPNQQMLSVHILFHTASKDEVAADIDRSIAEEKEQRKNRRQMKSDGSCICEHCGKSFAKSKYLRDHVQRLHQLSNAHKPYQCDICGKRDKTRRGIGKHVKNVHLVIPVSCHLCGKIFKNKNTMSYHMKYHDNSKYIHFCPLCPDRAPWCTAVALKRHQESNHGNGAGYTCEFCKNLFVSRSELRQHRLNEHGVQ